MIPEAGGGREGSVTTDTLVQNGEEDPPTIGFWLFHAKN
jgi:hypothetical protein